MLGTSHENAVRLKAKARVDTLPFPPLSPFTALHS